MKKLTSLFACVIIMTFVSSPLFAILDLTGTWKGIYSNNKGHIDDSLSCSIYHLNDSIHGLIYNDGESSAIHGRLSIGYDSIYVTVSSSPGNEINAQALVFSDSVAFTYASSDSLTIGFGHVINTAPTRTLIVHYNYSGEKEVSAAIPLRIDLYDDADISSSLPVYSIEYTTSSGTAYITGVPADTVYCMLYAAYSDSLRMFDPIEVPYAVYGNSATMECDTIVITPGNEEEITLNCDDSYLYPMDPIFQGGKLSVINTVSLSYQPKSITSDPERNIYIINNINEALHYNKNIELQGTLKDSGDEIIYANQLKFAPDSSFYVLYNDELIHYSKTHTYLESVNVGSGMTDLAIDANGNVFCSSGSEILRFNSDLSTQTASLNLTAIKIAYPDIDLFCSIKSIAVNNDNMVAIGIDAEPDDDGKDVVLFYNNDLSQFDHAIWEGWLFNNPINIDFDTLGNTYVLSYWHDIVVVLDPHEKRYKASYWEDLPGTLNGAMYGPADLTLAGSNLYVIENVNNRLTIYRYIGFIDENKVVADTTIHNSESACFDALDTLTLAGDILSPVVIEGGSSVNLVAGHSIRLMPGFYAHTDSYVHGYITTDYSFCEPDMQSMAYIQPEQKSVKTNNLIVTRPLLKTEKQVKVYPNPTDGQFTVELSNFEGPAIITLISPLGSVVSQTIVNSSEQTNIQLSTYNKGLYFVQIRSGNTIRTNKIMIK